MNLGYASQSYFSLILFSIFYVLELYDWNYSTLHSKLFASTLHFTTSVTLYISFWYTRTKYTLNLSILKGKENILIEYIHFHFSFISFLMNNLRVISLLTCDQMYHISCYFCIFPNSQNSGECVTHLFGSVIFSNLKRFL